MLDRIEGIGCRLKLMLRLNRMTQTEACELTRISKNAMSNYVNENRIPESPILYKLAKLFGVSMEWLLTGKDLTIHESADYITDYLQETIEEIIKIHKNLKLHSKNEFISNICNAPNKDRVMMIDQIANLLETYLKSYSDNYHLAVLSSSEYNCICNFKQLPAQDRQAISEFISIKLRLTKEQYE